MTIEGIDEVNASILFPVGMPDDDDVAPTCLEIIRVHDHAMRGAGDFVTKIRVSTAISIPIFSQVTTRVKPTGEPVPIPFRLSHRVIEAVRQILRNKLSGNCGKAPPGSEHNPNESVANASGARAGDFHDEVGNTPIYLSEDIGLKSYGFSKFLPLKEIPEEWQIDPDSA